MAIFRRRRPNGGKNRDFRPIYCLGIDDCWSVECRQHIERAVIYHAAAFVYRSWRVRHASVNLVYDSKAHTGRAQRTEILIARSGKSEAEVTNNKRLWSKYCTVEANYWQTRSIARTLCNSIGELLVSRCFSRLHVKCRRVCRCQFAVIKSVITSIWTSFSVPRNQYHHHQ